MSAVQTDNVGLPADGGALARARRIAEIDRKIRRLGERLVAIGGDRSEAEARAAIFRQRAQLRLERRHLKEPPCA